MARRERRWGETWSAWRAATADDDTAERPDAVPDDVERAAVARGIGRRFAVGDDVVAALVDVDVDVPVGHTTVVAGPSGSGKSTLLSILGCLQRPDAGTVTIGATDVLALGRRGRRAVRRDRLGIVLPQPSDNLLDGLDALGNVRWAAAQRERTAAGGASTEEAPSLLAAVGLAAAQHRRVRELSGGEQQRLAVACALAGYPELILLDEPTASLDRASATALVEVLVGAAARGSTMVIATHDARVMEAADVLVRLDHGRRVR